MKVCAAHEDIDFVFVLVYSFSLRIRTNIDLGHTPFHKCRFQHSRCKKNQCNGIESIMCGIWKAGTDGGMHLLNWLRSPAQLVCHFSRENRAVWNWAFIRLPFFPEPPTLEQWQWYPFGRINKDLQCLCVVSDGRLQAGLGYSWRRHGQSIPFFVTKSVNSTWSTWFYCWVYKMVSHTPSIVVKKQQNKFRIPTGLTKQ